MLRTTATGRPDDWSPPEALKFPAGTLAATAERTQICTDFDALPHVVGDCLGRPGNLGAQRGLG